jgi:hypothetical protein
LPDDRDEPVAAAGDGDDEPILARRLAKRATQRGHKLVQAVLFDDDAIPNGRHDRCLVQHLAGMFDEVDESVEGLWLQRDGLPVQSEQQPAARIEAKSTELVDHRHSRDWRSEEISEKTPFAKA